VERKFQGTKVPGNESSMERKFQGAKVPPMELLLPGAKVRGNESSIIPQIRCIPIYTHKKTTCQLWFQRLSTGILYLSVENTCIETLAKLLLQSQQRTLPTAKGKQATSLLLFRRQTQTHSFTLTTRKNSRDFAFANVLVSLVIYLKSRYLWRRCR